MADEAPSDFVSYSQLLGLNKDDIAGAQRRAELDYQQAQAAAEEALTRSGREAVGGYWGGSAPASTVAVSSTASYGEYLKAREQARSAYAKVSGGVGGEGGARGAMMRNATARGGEGGGAELDRREAEWNKRSGMERDSRASYDEAGRARQQREAAEKAQKDFDEAQRRQGQMAIYAEKLRKAATRRAKFDEFELFGPGQYNIWSSGSDTATRPDNATDWAGRDMGPSQSEIKELKAGFLRNGGDQATADQYYHWDQPGRYEGGKWIPNKK